MAIPQHRPSAAPLPRTEEQRKVRELTEEEEILRKAYGMTKEEYLEEQQKPSDEVVEPGFSRDRW